MKHLTKTIRKKLTDKTPVRDAEAEEAEAVVDERTAAGERMAMVAAAKKEKRERKSGRGGRGGRGGGRRESSDRGGGKEGRGSNKKGGSKTNKAANGDDGNAKNTGGDGAAAAVATQQPAKGPATTSKTPNMPVKSEKKKPVKKINSFAAFMDDSDDE